MSTRAEIIDAQSKAFRGLDKSQWNQHFLGPSGLKFLFDQLDELEGLKKALKELASKADQGLIVEQKVDYLNAHHLKAHHD